MSNFFFFTDVDSVGNQPAADAFGPGVGSTDTQFRVTSTHRPTPTATPAAYAVCDGLLLVQDAGNSLVNLILKPTEQPPFAFPKIKFFIYRGIQKSTLVSGSEVAPSATNDLTKSIWDSQNARNASANSTDHAPAEALGIDISGNGPIDDVFYREDVNFQLPLVRAGWSLGKFDTAQFGFEIMVEAIGFDPELPLVRTSANIITVAALAGSPTQAQEFEYWHDKEAILNYSDPCAFFGGFYFHSLRVKYADGSAAKNKKKNEIYDEVLKGAHLAAASDGVFFNRNRTYLDIRNEYNHSINYFKNYGTYSNTDINCAFEAGASLVARNYYDSSWPLMIIEATDLPSGNTSSNNNIIRIALPDGAGDNPFPTLYMSAGHLVDLYPREPKDKAKLIDLNVSSGFTDEVSLAIPNRDGLASTTAISSYIKLKYLKRIDPGAQEPPVSSGTVIRAESFLDNLFKPFDIKIPFPGSERIKSVIYDAEVFVDMSLAGGYDCIGSVGIFDDGTTYTFILNPKIVRTKNEKKSTVVPFSGEKLSGADVWTHIASKSGNKVALKSSLEFSGTPASVDYVKIVDNEGDPPYDEPYLGLIIISCNKGQLIGTDKTVFTEKSPIYLRANSLARYADELGQEYWSFDLSLIGYWLNGSRLEVKEVPSNLTIYMIGHFNKADDIQVGTQKITTQAFALPIVSPIPPIKHVFVLMLENRAFDHMLGFSNIMGKDAITGLATTIEGASSANTNIDFDDIVNHQQYPAKTPADFQIPAEDFGPPHEFRDALRQLCALNEGSYNEALGVYPTPNNGGFLYSYRNGLQESDPRGAEASPHPEKILNCFHQDQLPVLTTLAREFAVCDHWFSSLPGPTWPNRFFVHAATSGGLPTSPKFGGVASSITVAGYDFQNGHIFDKLGDRGIDWRIFEGDEFPQVFSLDGMNYSSFTGHYTDMDKFTARLMSQNFSPTYVFIEPNYGKLSGGNAHQFLGGTSQHPRDDVRPGERLIKQVYETIRNSPHWKNSVLVITYDEHGGFYDHVSPLTTQAPADKSKYKTSNRFNFSRLGVRVPAVIISPLIPKGTIDHTVYDHSSILKTLEKMFRLNPLTQRDMNAKDFTHLFSLTKPRITAAEAPIVLPSPPGTFPNAAGGTTYTNMSDPDVGAPLTIPNEGGIPIDGPKYFPSIRFEEEDLKLLLLMDPSLQFPTELDGDTSPDLLAWLHVAFRRRLALRLETNLDSRKAILRQYCSIRTVQAAEDFIDLARQEVQAFRALPIPTPLA